MTNASCPKLELCLQRFGIQMVMEDFRFFVGLPVGLIGFVLNSMCVFVLLKHSKRFFNTKFYTYLKLVCITSAVINFMDIFYYVSNRNYSLWLANTHIFFYFLTKIYYPLMMFLYSSGNLLNCALNYDRLHFLNANLRIFNKISPYYFIIFINTNISILNILLNLS